MKCRLDDLTRNRVDKRRLSLLKGIIHRRRKCLHVRIVYFMTGNGKVSQIISRWILKTVSNRHFSAKIREAEEHMKQGEKDMKISMFKWKPDLDSASSHLIIANRSWLKRKQSSSTKANKTSFFSSASFSLEFYQPRRERTRWPGMNQLKLTCFLLQLRRKYSFDELFSQFEMGNYLPDDQMLRCLFLFFFFCQTFFIHPFERSRFRWFFNMELGLDRSLSINMGNAAPLYSTRTFFRLCIGQK